MSSLSASTLHNGKYTLQRQLGQGSVYVAYQASCVGYDKPVVLLRLHDALQQQPEFTSLQKAFALEAKRVSSCQHPHLIRLLELFIDRGLVYLAVEYVPGQTLTDIVQTTGCLTIPQALHYMRQISDAVMTLHQHSILHRHLSPQIMMRRQGTDFVVLTDLGIGREFLSSRQLLPGTLAVGYAAPEQHSSGVAHTPATDVYGLAAILYYLLTGQVPTPAPLRDRSPISNLRQYQPHLSPSLEQGILAGLSLDPKQRPQTVATWLEMIADDSRASIPRQSASSGDGVVVPAAASIGGAAPLDVAPVSIPMTPIVASLPTEPMPIPLSPAPVAASHAITSPSAARSSVATANPPITALDPPAMATPPMPIKRKTSPLTWLMLASTLALVVGVGTGLAFRIWLMTQSGVPTLQPDQSFPERPWPGF